MKPEKDYNEVLQRPNTSAIKEESNSALYRKENLKPSSQRPLTSKPVTGQRKPGPVKVGGEVHFQCQDLERENLALKEKENLLEREITKMHTKLRRIEELMKSGREFSDKSYAAFLNDLEDQFNEMKDENDILKDRTHGETTQFNQDLKGQLIKVEKEVFRLQQEKDRLQQSSTGNRTVDDIMRQIKEADLELRRISNDFENLELKQREREEVFSGTKNYMENILDSLRKQRIDNETLNQKNLSLEIQAQQCNSMSDQLSGLEHERDQIEKSIRTLTSEPFFKREKGESTLKRVADLEDKAHQKMKVAAAHQAEEAKKQEEFNTLKTNVERLRGEKDYLEKESGKLKGRFTGEKEFSELNVYKTLFKMDPQRYGDTMHDIMTGPDSIPNWAGIDFLERGTEQLDYNNVKALKVEILKLKHENKDFAAELEKAQNLLKLQKDIERENTQYYDGEKKRLEILQRSTQMKAEELARMADEKARQISEAQTKLGVPQSRQTSPDKSQTLRQQLDQMETQSEFSVMTNESDMRTDENVLDFVIQDAEFMLDAFDQILDTNQIRQSEKSLITFVTIDFYNHNTETSQIAEGLKPMYNTQFSFKNKIDDFYVQYLQKQCVRVDFYISRNNTAILVGRSEIFLKELIERETAVQDIAFKTPVIQRVQRVFAISGNKDRPLGNIRYRMRMRKPISEAMRFYREKNEIANLASHASQLDQDQRIRKRQVTIQVIRCHDLSIKYSAHAKVQPFFYYQFYTFEERYSATSFGTNPVFDDSFSYDLTFDSKVMSYLQREELEVILFDDSAPVTGVERGAKALTEGDQVEDMIGIAKVPLKDILRGATIHDNFPIRNMRREMCGQVEVKITVMDLEPGFGSIGGAKLQQTLHYNLQWEREIIHKIACKLRAFPANIELLFGIFSRGQKTCSKEDFKYCCLNRLNLREEINEREMDMFLRSSPQLVDKEFIDKNDFLILFSSAVAQARQEQLDEEAKQYTTIRKFEEISRSAASFRQMEPDDLSRSVTPMKDFNLQSSTSNLNFNEQEVLELMSKIKEFGRVDQLMDDITRLCDGPDSIKSQRLIEILSRHGSVSEMEARKIVRFVEVQQQVKISKFRELFEKASSIHSIRSTSLRKFNELILQRGEALAKRLIEQDYNRDGDINIDGLTAALMNQEFQFRREDIREIFSILQKRDVFQYGEYLLQVNPNLRIALNSLKRTMTPVPIQSLSKSDTKQSLEKASVSATSSRQEDPKIQEIKRKMKQYLQTNDLSLSSLFDLIDTNSDKQLTEQEYLQKMRLLKIDLDDQELGILFRAMDKTNSRHITYQQFIMEFQEINVAYMIKKIKGIIVGSKVPVSSVFDKYCSDKKNMRLSEGDFKRFVKVYYERAKDPEVSSLFKHFDSNNKGFITEQEFKTAFDFEVKEYQFTINIEDIVKPLATKIKEWNVNIAQLFDKYDKNKNGRLSARELAMAFYSDYKIQLEQEEVQIIQDFFKNKYNTLEIGKSQFIELMQKKYERVFDEEQAKGDLAQLKLKLQNIAQLPAAYLKLEDTERTGNLPLRSFKRSINNLHVLNQYSIDNLARYLDKSNNGFISAHDFEFAINQAIVHQPTTVPFSETSSRRNKKWSSTIKTEF